MMFCFGGILQIWIILIGFRDTNAFVNLGICKHNLNSPAEAIADLSWLMLGFFRQNDLILSEVFFVYGKEQESL